jgi:hypothetical protein
MYTTCKATNGTSPDRALRAGSGNLSTGRFSSNRSGSRQLMHQALQPLHIMQRCSYDDAQERGHQFAVTAFRTGARHDPVCFGQGDYSALTTCQHCGSLHVRLYDESRLPVFALAAASLPLFSASMRQAHLRTHSSILGQQNPAAESAPPNRVSVLLPARTRCPYHGRFALSSLSWPSSRT